MPKKSLNFMLGPLRPRFAHTGRSNGNYSRTAVGPLDPRFEATTLNRRGEKHPLVLPAQAHTARDPDRRFVDAGLRPRWMRGGPVRAWCEFA